MKQVVKKTTYRDIVQNGYVKINAKGKVIINKVYFNSLTHHYKIGFMVSVKALKRALMRDRILPGNVIGNDHKLAPNVVVDKNNNVIDPTTMSKKRYGVYKAHMTIRAKKAGLLPKINGTSQPKSYDTDEKREVVKQFTDRCLKYGKGEVLALESPDFLCAKALPDYNFTIYERDTDVMKAMRRNRGSISNIVDLIKGDIVKVPHKHFDYAFPDFCDTYKTNEYRIKLLSKRLHDTKFIAFTFACRSHGFDIDEGDAQFATMERLKKIFKNHVIDYCKTYKGSKMYFIILKRKDLE